MGTQALIKLQGIVIAAAWDPSGDVAEVDIAGYDEKRYRVADDHMGRKLRAYIKKRIIADGMIETGVNGIVIYVHHFRIDPPDPTDTIAPK